MKLIDELYPNEEELTKFFDKIDWVTVGKIINEAGAAMGDMDKRKGQKFAFDLFLIVSKYFPTNILEVLKK